MQYGAQTKGYGRDHVNIVLANLFVVLQDIKSDIANQL